MRPRKWGRFMTKASLESAFDDAKIEIGMLQDEMQSWADNMSGTGLENTQKYSDVEECAEYLSNAVSSLENIELPAELKEEEVEYGYWKARYMSRGTRLSTAQEQLGAVKDKIEERLREAEAKRDKSDVTDDKWEKENEKVEPLEQIFSELEEAISELESVMFPGMY